MFSNHTLHEGPDGPKISINILGRPIENAVSSTEINHQKKSCAEIGFREFSFPTCRESRAGKKSKGGKLERTRKTDEAGGGGTTCPLSYTANPDPLSPRRDQLSLENDHYRYVSGGRRGASTTE